jgi:hypothetical protein
MAGINQVLRWLSWMMVVIAPVLFVRELQSQPWRVAVRLAVAGLVGMIPEGLVLLTCQVEEGQAARFWSNKQTTPISSSWDLGVTAASSVSSSDRSALTSPITPPAR